MSKRPTRVVFYASDKAREIMIAKAFGEGVLRAGGEYEIRRTGDYGSGRLWEGPGFTTDVACMFGVKGRSQQILKEHRLLDLGALFFDKGYTRDRGEGGHTEWTRISVNDSHPLAYMMRERRPKDRLHELGIKWRDRQNARAGHILIATSSQKYNDFHGLGDAYEHASTLVQRISKMIGDRVQKLNPLIGDHQIIYRPKPSASPVRPIGGASTSHAGTSIKDALRGAFLLVTHGASAAMDAIVAGVPAVSLGPSIAAPVCSRELDEATLAEPHWPMDAERGDWARAMAYCQFTLAEMRSGLAWDILKPEIARQCGSLMPSARITEIKMP